MLEQPAPDWMLDEAGEHLLRIEPAARPQHPEDLSQAVPPAGDVVDDPEIKDGIVVGVRTGDVARVADPQPHSRAPIGNTLACEGYHSRIQIEGIDALHGELLEDDLYTDTAAAPDLEDPAPGKPAPHS